ncbi:MAG TPA: hypothetical protein VHW66_21880 [Stellaceae bacterium]|jgi:hypothetical protein|nr:hypothetical protein [Stellaceae bacterium]
MAFNHRPGPTKHDKENARAARRVRKDAKRELRREAKAPPPPRTEQFPTRFPGAPESAAGVGRVLSRGLP